MKIREAVITDITRIIRFITDHEHLLGDADPKPQPGILRRQLKLGLKSKDMAIFIALDKDNQIKGVIVCWIAAYFWNHERYVTDILFLADQHGNLLMNVMEKWGKANGAKRATMQTHNCFDPRVELLYQRKGYQPSGSVFEKVF